MTVEEVDLVSELNVPLSPCGERHLVLITSLDDSAYVISQHQHCCVAN